MSVRYEYMSAKDMGVQYGPEFEIRGWSEEAMAAVEAEGAEEIGPFGDDGLTREMVLALSGDEVTVVAGTPEEILALLDRARRAVLAGMPAPEPKEYDHDAQPDDLPEPGDRCRYCGEEITWMGPGSHDWLHVNDVKNQ